MMAISALWLAWSCADPPPTLEPLPTASADQRERLERYRADCAAGEARGCAALGSRYLKGDGVARDPARALALYQRACAAGQRCAVVGGMVLEGLGTAADPTAAAGWLERACEQGEPEGCGNLGVLYQRGRGVPTDLSAAVRYFTRGCEGGDASACANLGYLYQYGDGVSADLERARGYYRRACDAGDRTGCNNLAVLSDEAITGQILSPSDGARIDVPRIPVGVTLPPGFGLDTEIQLLLDDRPIPAPLLVVREGLSGAGKGSLALAAFDLWDVAPGPHTLVVDLRTPAGAATHQQTRLRSRFDWSPPPHRVIVRTVDARGRPVEARVRVEGPTGPVAMGGPDADRLDPQGRAALLHSAFSAGGVTRLRLDSGPHRLLAFAGITRDLGLAELEVSGDVELTLALPRVVDIPRALVADLHVHTRASADAHLPHRLRADSLRASGLDVAVITDHRAVTAIDELQAAAAPVRLVSGVEAGLRDTEDASTGHANVFPAARGWQERRPQSLADVVAAGHSQDALVQLNHPRGIQFNDDNPPRPWAHALFNHMALDPGAGPDAAPWLTAGARGERAADIDALEVVNRFSWPLYRSVRADWFALLRWGLIPTATGNSDSHGLALEEVGVTVNLVRAPEPGEDDLEPVLWEAAFFESVAAGRVRVSTGPLVDLEVIGEGVAGPGGTVRPAQDGTVTARVRVEAAPWVPVHELRLVANGALVLREDLAPLTGAVLRAERSVTVPMPADGWLVAEAGWPIADERRHRLDVGGVYSEVAPGFVPIGFTNPVKVDADGDGRWAPGGRSLSAP